MVDPIGIAGAAVDVAPLLKRAVDAVVGNSGVAKLRRLVAADLRRGHQIDGSKREVIADVWSSQGVDLDLNSALTSWLASGDETKVNDAGTRWRTLLSERRLELCTADVDRSLR